MHATAARPRENGNPGRPAAEQGAPWIPACAAMNGVRPPGRCNSCRTRLARRRAPALSSNSQTGSIRRWPPSANTRPTSPSWARAAPAWRPASRPATRARASSRSSRAAEPGGAAIISGGGCLIVGSPLQKQNGIDDTPDLAFKDWITWGGPSADAVWARYYIEHTLHDLYHWAEGFGVKWVDLKVQEGNSVLRWTRAGRNGLGLMTRAHRGLPQERRRDRSRHRDHRADAARTAASPVWKAATPRPASRWPCRARPSW